MIRVIVPAGMLGGGFPGETITRGVELGAHAHRDRRWLRRLRPAILADALGLSPQTAIRHARRGSGQYGAYIADRIDADIPVTDLDPPSPVT
jgi:hypothetical protein